jgi:hypothetical protein
MWISGLQFAPCTSYGVLHQRGVSWCTIYGCDAMKAKKKKESDMMTQNPAVVRASISFPPGVYETLESIAKEKKVSVAWVVRDAAEKYIAEKWPLFAKNGE